MDDREADPDRADLISQMFAVLTARLEDGAALAAECQGRRPVGELRQDLLDLREVITDAGAVADAIRAVLGR